MIHKIVANYKISFSGLSRETWLLSVVILINRWRDGFFVRFLLMVSMYMICFSLLFRFVPVYWKEQMHIGESTIGILLGMNGIVIALFEMLLIQTLRDRRPDFYYIIAGTVFSGFAFLMLLIPTAMPVMLAVLSPRNGATMHCGLSW